MSLDRSRRARWRRAAGAVAEGTPFRGSDVDGVRESQQRVELSERVAVRVHNETGQIRAFVVRLHHSNHRGTMFRKNCTSSTSMHAAPLEDGCCRMSVPKKLCKANIQLTSFAFVKGVGTPTHMLQIDVSRSIEVSVYC